MAEETAALAPETPIQTSQRQADSATNYHAMWRAMPTLGDGLVRVALAFVLGLLTGILWSLVGRQPPSGFLPTVGWALILGAASLVAIIASAAVERDLRGQALAHALPVLVTALIAVVVALLALALILTLLPDATAVAAPIFFSLALGLGAGFALGGMRLWGMSADARWLFFAFGLAALFGVTVTFLTPAVLSPQDNGSLGIYGILIFVIGLLGVVPGSIAGGALRMRAEVEAYGYRPNGSTTTADPALPLDAADDPTPPMDATSAPTSLEQPPNDQPAEPLAPEWLPMTSDDLIATLTTQRQQLLDALTGLTDEQLDRKGLVGDWSIKNALAHLAVWEQVVARITPERLRTGDYPEELRAINADEDANNARETAECEHLTPTEQLAELAQARADLTAVIRSLGDDALAREHPWPEWDPPLSGYFIEYIGGHETEHAQDILSAATTLRTA